MKIGHYMNGLFLPGGTRSYLRRVTGAQVKQGHEVVLFDRENRATGSQYDGSGVRFTRDDTELLRVAHELSLDLLHVHTPVAYQGKAPLPIMRTLHDHNAYCPSGSRFLSTTHVPCPRTYTLSGCAAGHLFDRCGSLRPLQFFAGFQRVWQEQRVLPTQRCIAISEFTKREMVRSGYDASNVTVVNNPAPAACSEAAVAPALNTGPPRFVFVGRIVPGKGLEWLIQSAAQVSGDAHFEIIGDGNDKPRLLQLTRQLGIAERFTWRGWLDDEQEIATRLAAARAVIFPSLWHEPAGLVTMESAAAGRALIASRVGGIPEYAEKLGHALLVPPNDIAALSGAIAELARDADVAARLGRAGWLQIRAGKFSLDRHLTELDEVYSRAMARTPVSAGHS